MGRGNDHIKLVQCIFRCRETVSRGPYQIGVGKCFGDPEGGRTENVILHGDSFLSGKGKAKFPPDTWFFLSLSKC